MFWVVNSWWIMSAGQENTTALCFPRKIGTDIGEELLKCGLPNIYVPSFQKHRESVKKKADNQLVEIL